MANSVLDRRTAHVYRRRVGKHAKTLASILSGRSDANIRFGDLRALLEHLRFHCRVKGSHHIFYRDGVDEILNLQERNGKAKSYQVKQVRNVILKYRMGTDDDE